MYLCDINCKWTTKRVQYLPTRTTPTYNIGHRISYVRDINCKQTTKSVQFIPTHTTWSTNNILRRILYVRDINCKYRIPKILPCFYIDAPPCTNIVQLYEDKKCITQMTIFVSRNTTSKQTCFHLLTLVKSHRPIYKPKTNKNNNTTTLRQKVHFPIVCYVQQNECNDHVS